MFSGVGVDCLPLHRGSEYLQRLDLSATAIVIRAALSTNMLPQVVYNSVLSAGMLGCIVGHSTQDNGLVLQVGWRGFQLQANSSTARLMY